MKFSINKRYNGTIEKVLNNQQLEMPYPLFVLLFSQLCKNGHSMFFSSGLLLNFRRLGVPIILENLATYFSVKLIFYSDFSRDQETGATCNSKKQEST